MYNCTWIITAPSSNHTVKLTFTRFNLFDYLTILRSEIKVFDGRSKNDTLLGIFSGSRRPFIVQTSGQFMMLTFKRYHKLGFFSFEGVYSSTSIKGELYVPRKQFKTFRTKFSGWIMKRPLWLEQLYYNLLFYNHQETPNNNVQFQSSMYVDKWGMSLLHDLVRRPRERTNDSWYFVQKYPIYLFLCLENSITVL